MKIDVLTIFPEMITDTFRHSLIGKAVAAGLLNIQAHDIRKYAPDKHRTVDDTPYGGGTGMVMMVEPLYRAIKAIDPDNRSRKLIMDASGWPFSQKIAKELMLEEWLLIICGHYKGIDERIKQLFEMTEISIGDYVLSGGEIPALVVIDAVCRLVPGVIKEVDSAMSDSYFNGLLGWPEYTRPREFQGISVPDILISGDHEKIRKWRLGQSLNKTKKRRPDLLAACRQDSEISEILDAEDEHVEND